MAKNILSKNMFRVFLFTILSFNIAIISQSRASDITGSENIITQYREINNFTKIDFNTVGTLIIEQIGQADHENLLTIESDDNIIPCIDTVVNNDILIIDTKKSFSSKTGINIKISVKDLTKISLHGAGKININKLDTKSIIILLKGAGSINIQELNCDKLDAEISGVGKLNIKSGKAADQNIKISGCASFDGQNLVGDIGDIKLSDCAKAEVNIHAVTVKKTGAICSFFNINSFWTKTNFLRKEFKWLLKSELPKNLYKETKNFSTPDKLELIIQLCQFKLQLKMDPIVTSGLPDSKTPTIELDMNQSLIFQYLPQDFKTYFESVINIKTTPIYYF